MIAGALLVLALAGPFELERIPLSDCTRREDQASCRFPAPERLAERQVRLEAACESPLRVNRIPVDGGSQVRTITGLLAGRGGNEVSGPATCLPLVLLVTPRVYISDGVWQAAPAGVRIEVVNSLDNTVNVGLVCRQEGGNQPEWTGSGTVSALSSQEFLWPAGGGPGPGTRLICDLEKQPESAEESYTFRWVYKFHTLTEIGRPNHR
jgi:hypothetical protein